MTGDLDYIRNHYGVPAAPRTRVTADGKPGVIVGATGPHLLVHIDGEPDPTPWHPTWRMQYHADAA